MEFITEVIAFIILLPIIVFVHEFGHFIFARINGVKVEAFSIGFGPAIFKWKDKYNTAWKICIIPLGGYVKMLGQSDTPESAEQRAMAAKKLTAKEKKQSFEFKKRYQKAAIVAAGPVFNFIFGFVVFCMLFWFIGLPKTSSVILDVKKNSAAYTAGIKVGDIILSVNDVEISKSQNVSKIVRNSNGATLKIRVKRDKKILSLNVKPIKENDSYLLGISYGSRFEQYEKLGFVASIKEAYFSTMDIVSTTIKSLGEMITRKRSSKELGGIISIAKVSGDALSMGMYSFMYLVALISISLGLFNLFPIPVLDGGYLFIYLIEGIIRHDLPEKAKEVMFFLGFVFIIFLLVLSNMNDVMRLIK